MSSSVVFFQLFTSLKGAANNVPGDSEIYRQPICKEGISGALNLFRTTYFTAAANAVPESLANSIHIVLSCTAKRGPFFDVRVSGL